MRKFNWEQEVIRQAEKWGAEKGYYTTCGFAYAEDGVTLRKSENFIKVEPSSHGKTSVRWDDKGNEIRRQIGYVTNCSMTNTEDANALDTYLEEHPIYLCNVFSLQMLEDLNATIEVCEVEVTADDLKKCKSAVGHADTANVLGVECNRQNIKLQKGDILVVAQLIGGRLPEGSTTLPEGFEFKFVLVEIK